MTATPPIVPRKVDLGFPTPVPRHWAGDPLLTRVADALSLLFPAGEQFFIQSVQAFRQQITDDTLRRQVKEFAYQEAQHSNAHAAYNQMLQDQGLNVAWVDRSLRRRLAFGNKFLTPVQRLALTATAEHFTATMAEGLIAAMHDHFAEADPRMRALYYWHAVEEIEHKSVAWDVYTRVAGGTWRRRVVAQGWTTVMITLNTLVATLYLLHQDGLLFDLGMWRRGLRTLWGRDGFFTRMVRPYLRGFRPGFHPQDTRLPRGFEAFVTAWRERADVQRATAAALAATAA